MQKGEKSDSKRWVVEVGYHHSKMDAKSRMLLHDLHELGFKHINSMRSAHLYDITGDFTRQQITEICRMLLVDPITQLYTFYQGSGHHPTLLGPPSLEVWPKQGTTDVVGDSVILAIKDLGFTRIQCVRTGQKYHFSGHTTYAELERIAQDLLANSLIQDHSVKDESTNSSRN